PSLLILKTTVVKYTPGSETRRAVTTVSGATKLTVRTQLLTREGEIVVDRTVNGNVRFFGSNLGGKKPKRSRKPTWVCFEHCTTIFSPQLRMPVPLNDQAGPLQCAARPRGIDETSNISSRYSDSCHCVASPPQPSRG